jgi:Thrombospondin type 3 repeat/RTX calcium-binding nonapeptide repeat (4 copies)
VRRVGAFVVVLAGLAALAPSAASAHSLVRSGGGLVSYISADATSLNTLAVRQSGNRVEFRDDSVDGGMDPGGCTPGDVDANGYIVQTFCALGGVQRVRIDLGEREDSASVSLGLAVTLLGGPGADRISGGGAADEVAGGEGNDVVEGGPGDDVISGDQGVDTIGGGDGADRIAARDGEADSVSCGPGADTVDADTFDTVAADCESVSRTATQAPAGGADDGKPPVVDVGAPTLQVLGRSRVVRVYATTSERGTLSASGSLEAAGVALPVKKIGRVRVRVAGGGAVLTYRLTGRHWRLASRTLRRGKPVVVRLGVVGTDLSGRSRRRNAPAINLARGGGSARSSLFGVPAWASHPEPGDIDGDEVPDAVDNCPTIKNGGQANTDRDFAADPGPPPMPAGDAEGDACDADDDADGVLDAHPDNCRTFRNPNQEPGPDPRYGAACPPVDDDRDGVLREDDNCERPGTDPVANPDQADLDGDDRGDACDSDVDGDKLDNPYDNCATVYNLERGVDRNGDGYVNQLDQEDRDRDGIGTACDPDESVIGPIAPPNADRTRPRLTASVERRQRMAAVKAGLVVRLRCSEACAATAELSLDRRSARKLGLGRSRIVAGGSARLGGKGTTYAFVRFDRRARRKLFRMRRMSAKLTAVAVDGGGNRRSLSRRVELVR